MIGILPSNYNFEIHKSIWRIEELKVALKKTSLTIILQMPQGLQMFACLLADIFDKITNSEVYIIADENYGACCIEDVQASILKADFMIHYGGLNRTQLLDPHTRNKSKGNVCFCGYHV